MSADSIVETTSDLDEIIAELDQARGRFPEEALRAAQRNRDRIIPRLIRCLEDTADQAEQGEFPEGNAHFFAFFLVGEFRAREALPAILRIISLPGELSDELLGDALSGCLPSILAALNDDPDVLDRLIGDDEIGYYVRWAAASTYVITARDGRLERAEAAKKLYWNLRESVQQGIIENAGFLVAELSDFAHPAVLPGVREAFRLDLVDPFLIDEHDAVSIIQQGDSSFQEQLRACKSTGIEDTVEELRHWASFAEDEKDEALEDDDYDVEEIAAGIHQFLDQLVADRQFDSRANSTADDEDYPEPTAPIRREQQRVSRNQPCPCGSGKKYKRCCGSSG